MNTFVAAWDAFYAVLSGTTDPILTAGNVNFYQGEPAPGDLQRGIAISIQPIGWDDFNYEFVVRTYAHTDQNVLDVQRDLMLVVDALDALWQTQDIFERAAGQIEWDEKINSFVAVSVFRCGRGLQ